MYEHVFLVVHIPMQNKQWALGSGFMKDDVLVVLLWTEKKKKKFPLWRFGSYLWSVVMDNIVLAVLLIAILPRTVVELEFCVMM
jgi:hypothetical protein